jgi:FMN reductase (NADPH)
MGNTTMTNNPALKSLQSHKSVRKFTSESISDDQLETLIATGQRASTSSNLQPYSVVAVRDQARKDHIAELCGGQSQIRQCAVFLAICADLNRANIVAASCGYELQTDHMEQFVVSTIDAALFGQQILSAAEASGLGGCMIGGARNDPAGMAETLGLPPLVFVVFGMTLGHPVPDRNTELRPRLPLSGVLHHERYDPQAMDKAHQAYDQTTITTGFYGSRRIDLSKGVPGWTDTTPDGAYGWMEHTSRRWIDPSATRVALRGFLDDAGFGFK